MRIISIDFNGQTRMAVTVVRGLPYLEATLSLNIVEKQTVNLHPVCIAYRPDKNDKRGSIVDSYKNELRT